MIDFIDYGGDKVEISSQKGECYLKFDASGANIYMTPENAAQVWPILKHFAETGELVEKPEEDKSTLADLANAMNWYHSECAQCGKQSVSTTPMSYCMDCGVKLSLEKPNVIDDSIPARDNAVWSDSVVERLTTIEDRLDAFDAQLEKTGVAIDSIGRGMYALDERLKTVEAESDKESGPVPQIAKSERCNLEAILFNGPTQYSETYTSRLAAIVALVQFLQQLSAAGLKVKLVNLRTETGFSASIYYGVP